MKKTINMIYKVSLFVAALLVVNGCADDDTDLGPAPEAQFSIDTASEFQEGKEISFVNESTGGKSFLWSFGDGETAYGNDVSHTYNAAGSYTVTLEASANGKKSVVSQTVDITAIEYELFFIDNDNLAVQKLMISAPGTVTKAFDLPGFGFGLAYDASNDELYYADDDNFKVYKNSVSGGSEVELASGLSSPRDIAVDITNDRIFVVERGINQVTAIKLSDKSTSAHFSIADDALYSLPVGLDVANGQIFTTAVDFDAETVWTADLDGSNLQKLIDYSAGGFGYGIEVDEQNGRIYFDDNDSGSLLSAELDGSDIQTIGSSSGKVYGIAINKETGKVYWASTDGVIKEANLDGSDEKILTETGVDIRGLILRKVN